MADVAGGAEVCKASVEVTVLKKFQEVGIGLLEDEVGKSGTMATDEGAGFAEELDFF